MLPLQELITDTYTHVRPDSDRQLLVREVVDRCGSDTCLDAEPPPSWLTVLGDLRIDKAVQFGERNVVVLTACDDLIVLGEVDFEWHIESISKSIEIDAVLVDPDEAIRIYDLIGKADVDQTIKRIVDDIVLNNGILGSHTDIRPRDDQSSHLSLEGLDVLVHLLVEIFQFLHGSDVRAFLGIELAIHILEHTYTVQDRRDIVLRNVELVPKAPIPNECTYLRQ